MFRKSFLVVSFCCYCCCCCCLRRITVAVAVATNAPTTANSFYCFYFFFFYLFVRLFASMSQSIVRRESFFCAYIYLRNNISLMICNI